MAIMLHQFILGQWGDVTDITCDSVKGTIFKIVGVESQHIERVYLSNLNIKNAAREIEIKYVDDVIFDQIMIGGKLWHPK